MMERSLRARRRSVSSRNTFLSPVGSSMTRTRFGRPRSGARRRRSKPLIFPAQTSRPSPSPINARPSWCGIAPPVVRFTAPSCGKIGALNRSCDNCVTRGMKRRCARRRDSRSIHISAHPRLRGFSMHARARATVHSAVNSHAEPLTHGCCGISRAALCMRPMHPTRHARCSRASAA